VELERVLYDYRQHVGSLSIAPRNPCQDRLLEEYLVIAERYLDGSAIPAQLRRTLLDWHMRESLDAGLLALRSNRYVDAARYAVRGWSRNRGWPLGLLRRLCRRLAAPTGEEAQPCRG